MKIQKMIFLKIFLINTYISMALMTALISVLVGIISFVVLLFYIEGGWNILLSALIVPGLPVLVLGGFYFYPSLESKTIARRIEQELPFVAIHMSAIAGSGIEPTQIFKIIAHADPQVS